MMKVMTDEKIIAQLRAIGAEHGWDELYLDQATFEGRPVYHLRRSSTPKGAKLGWPILFSTRQDGTLFELSPAQQRSLSPVDGLGQLIE